MTVRADSRRRPLARKELLPMAIEARRVFRKLGYVGKCVVSLAHIFPVLSRKLVTGIAGQLLSRNVSDMGELRIINLWQLRCSSARSALYTSPCLRFGGLSPNRYGERKQHQCDSCDLQMHCAQCSRHSHMIKRCHLLTIEYLRTSRIRPEGPIFNSHVRKGVEW